MKSIFSIEWMAQSSQSTRTEPVSGPRQTNELTACGTNSESLPGFYCRQRPKGEQESSDLGDYSHSGLHSPQHQTSHNAPQNEADFSSGTEEETSGYESEEGHSHSPTDPANTASTVPPSPPSGRRPRTAFTAEQINNLEQAFKRNAYLGTQDKAELCKKLNLSDKQIRNWFQNRRMKMKRTVQDALAHVCQANVASHFLHYPELQSYRASPYPRFHSAGQDSPLAAAPYVQPQSLQYASVLSAGMSRDPLYQYSSRPSVMLPSTAAPLMGPYPSYSPYY
ncbi:ventrally expressed dharma/bozozok antagonist [Eucyclogobius newberryi]|uniref:ventrally expressed dharma/bozozok antagonist n=1 Tax=Eucyclogobius newberryi TaxID=166745 RepID=UPI003B59FF0C